MVEQTSYDPHVAPTPVLFTDDGIQIAAEPRDTFLAGVRAAAEIARLSGRILPIKTENLPPSVSLVADQTPVKKQGARGTCWSFGAAAGLEAAYKRKYKLTLDLAPQYIFHLAKVMELYPDYIHYSGGHENNSTLWGFQDNSGIVHKLRRSAVCESRFAPYLNASEMSCLQKTIPKATEITEDRSTVAQSIMDAFDFCEGAIPTAARFNCIYMVGSSAAVNDPPSIADLEGVLAEGHEVVVDLTLDWTFDEKKNAYDYDPSQNGPGHTVLLVGYDRAAQVFTIKNSMGTEWRDNGYARVTYDFFKNCCFGANYIIDVVDPKVGLQKLSFWLGFWNIDVNGKRGTLIIRRYTDYRSSDGAPTKLGSYSVGEDSYDVNGAFDEGGQHCTAFIAPTTEKVVPGMASGQQLDLYCFSWDIEHAAGYVMLDGARYGAMLSRTPFPAQIGKTFALDDWIGSYDMNHDGTKGVLTIKSVSPVSGTYTDGNGKSSAIGGFAGSNSYELQLTIPLVGGDQKFDLLHHTTERGVFSGTTVWQGMTYGVIGLLKT
jgi:Papain family cysteine protease